MDEGFCVIEVLFDQDVKGSIIVSSRQIRPSPNRRATRRARAGGSGNRPNHEEYWSAIYGRIALPRPHEGAVQYEARRHCRPLCTMSSVSCRAAGGAKGSRSMFRDITARKETEQALRESEERFRQFAENSADTLWIINAETRQLEYLSPAYERMWGELTRGSHAESRIAGPSCSIRKIATKRRSLPSSGCSRAKRSTRDYRIVRPNDGEVRWIRDVGFADSRSPWPRSSHRRHCAGHHGGQGTRRAARRSGRTLPPARRGRARLRHVPARSGQQYHLLEPRRGARLRLDAR